MSEQVLRTAQRIQQRGYLLAGVSKGIFGLSYRDPSDERWRGFDIDLARAVAVAVLGDAEAVEFIPVSPEQRCQSVSSGLIDIGTFNASATLSRATEQSLVFV